MATSKKKDEGTQTRDPGLPSEQVGPVQAAQGPSTHWLDRALRATGILVALGVLVYVVARPEQYFDPTARIAVFLFGGMAVALLFSGEVLAVASSKIKLSLPGIAGTVAGGAAVALVTVAVLDYLAPNPESVVAIDVVDIDGRPMKLDAATIRIKPTNIIASITFSVSESTIFAVLPAQVKRIEIHIQPSGDKKSYNGLFDRPRQHRTALKMEPDGRLLVIR